ncbi:hypothetical protein GBAR_LOCUS6224 [Geodia barretti]|uniref:TPPC8 C-terminal Ig-like domain-containing protein n=2 Tax=Geodia barretti TaxID=519541 RepID=A0AA35RD02_GEOBA|nr:hypothetical protein GBAR_LOCUS6224 [Geodia barretti]
MVPVCLPQSMALLSEPSPHSVSPSHSPYDLVKHYVDHPASLVHRFSTGGASCQAPVIITLQNCSHCSVQASIELYHHHKEVQQDQKTGSKHPVPDSGVVWTGATCQRHITLPANSKQTLSVFANFTRPGVYNLQTVKVWARQEGTTDYHLQRWQRTSVIAVVEEGLGL